MSDKWTTHIKPTNEKEISSAIREIFDSSMNAICQIPNQIFFNDGMAEKEELGYRIKECYLRNEKKVGFNL